MIRFATRFVQYSIGQTVKEFLNDFGWMSDAPPFGTSPVAFHTVSPSPADLKQVDGNAVYVSFGDEPDHQPLELGGGMLRIEHIVFVDVIGVDASISLALAGDIKDRLSGLLGGTRFQRPKDPQTGSELPGYLGEFADVQRYQPDGERKTWNAISATCLMDFPGEES